MTFLLKAAVIGHPISHSKSPLIHTHWLERYNINGNYEAIDIAPYDLKDGIRQLTTQDYCGFNVTVPHKQSIMAFCDDIDPAAQAIGAVNTVHIQDGKLTGYNTDAYGFIENIKTVHSKFDFKALPATILGAGGAARAAVYALLQAGCPEIRITNRTIEHAKDIQKLSPSKIYVVPWDKREDALTACGLLVNTTSLGMAGQPPLEIELDAAQHEMIVNDIVYAPLITPLLKDAQSKGHKIVTGIGMLLHQARPAFEIFFGQLPDRDPDLLQKVGTAGLLLD